MTHIGKCIRKRLEERRMTVVWFAQQLSCSRTNVYKIFEKDHIDTQLLVRISHMLEYDFFQILSADFQKDFSEKHPLGI